MKIDEDARHIWFTADLHFSHPKIIDFCDRPISPEDHDEWLLERLNSKVGKKDTLYILGDVSMASREKTDKILDKIKGNKILILGNHDNNIKSSSRFGEITQIKNFNFNSPSYSNIHIVLCHYPIASWDRKVYGASHLYGHTHGRFKNVGLSFDIGIDDNGYYPLNLEEVIDKFTKISLDLM